MLTRSKGKIYVGSNKERELVTLIETVSAASDVIEPYIVLKGY